MQFELALKRLNEDHEGVRSALRLERTMTKTALNSFMPDSQPATDVKFAFIQHELESIRTFFQVKYKMEVAQAGQTAQLILTYYGHEISASAFVLFADSFMANRLLYKGRVAHVYYGELYSRLDGEVILSALADFIKMQEMAMADFRKVDADFIAELPAKLKELTDDEIVALVAIGNMSQKALIRGAISNYLNWSGRKPIPELADYIIPKIAIPEPA